MLQLSVVSCARSMAQQNSWSCPCHSSMVFHKFCRFKENVLVLHSSNWCNLNRGRASVTIGPGVKFFFLFRRMRCFLVNRVEGHSMDSLFVTNLTALHEGEKVPFRMSVTFRVIAQATAVYNRIDTMCYKHKCHQAEHVDGTGFVTCPRSISLWGVKQALPDTLVPSSCFTSSLHSYCTMTTSDHLHTLVNFIAVS
jgi:hypothetical protein